MKTKCDGYVTSMVKLHTDIYDMWVKAGQAAKEAAAGQFVSLYSKDGSRMLPRPISICEVDEKKELLRLVFRVVGEGTKEFAGLVPGDSIELIGPLGNGFSLTGGKSVLIGGGIGIPPMLQLAKELSKIPGREVTAVLGYRDGNTFLSEDFKPYASVIIATEDGSAGTKGNVIDAIKEREVECDVLYACGPAPMLKGVKNLAIERDIPAQISMEERMACGIGACLACICQTTETDEHSQVNNKRICKDGPVFEAREVELG